MLRRILEVLEHVVHEARSVHFANRGVVILGAGKLVHAIIVEDLYKLGESCPLVEHTLDRHLNLELIGGLHAEFDPFTDAIHDQIRKLQFSFIQVHEVGAVEQIELVVALLPLPVLKLLELRQ